MDAHDEHSATPATFQAFNSTGGDDGIAFVARNHQPGTGNRLDSELRILFEIRHYANNPRKPAQGALLSAIVILSLTLVMVIIYLIWDRATRCPLLNSKPKHDIEHGDDKRDKYPNTPDTIVDITSHCHDSMGRDLPPGHLVDQSYHKDMPLMIYVSPPSDDEPASPSEHSDAPSTPSSMGTPEGQEEFVYSGMSVGNRLRGQLMCIHYDGQQTPFYRYLSISIRIRQVRYVPKARVCQRVESELALVDPTPE
ncbi:hypothetical protein CPB86DRAFT_802370 [Serendipita vermifera]|nr:hypothetical protein CPB86DRAFT_802370 [Serendipita vermifera]